MSKGAVPRDARVLEAAATLVEAVQEAKPSGKGLSIQMASLMAVLNALDEHFGGLSTSDRYNLTTNLLASQVSALAQIAGEQPKALIGVIASDALGAIFELGGVKLTPGPSPKREAG